MKTLILPVKREYFEAIRDGSKKEEYRLVNEHWVKRLSRSFPFMEEKWILFHAQEYDSIVITLGYPPKTDTTRRIEFPWRGFGIKTITHPHFGPAPVRVFAIKLEKMK